jgi:hypothetical protein
VEALMAGPKKEVAARRFHAVPIPAFSAGRSPVRLPGQPATGMKKLIARLPEYII